LRPFVKLAASKREKLKQESERVGSAHKQVSDRVTELENQLKNLRANVTEKQEDAVKDKENSSTISSTGSSSSSSSSSNEVDKKEEEEELKTASGSIDDLLKELDDGR
jgi:chromosome segregation ATPase